ncbi:helix-turn-helix domain-containing protein [Rhodococcus spongiicola]|nr:helix-turn-helix transcriptional regulator [Rhodococcus spongiicola]
MKPDTPILDPVGDIDRTLSERASLYLRIANISQTKAAKALGYSRQKLARRLRGVSSLTGSDLVRIAKLTGANVKDFFGEETRA